jgi:hypothetical protein
MSGLTGDGEAFIDQIFRYSGNVPLNVTLETPTLVDDYSLVRRWLNLVRNFHHRLKDISISDLILYEATPYIFPRNTALPVLSSLTISIDSGEELNLQTILDCFQHAPLLCSLELCAYNAGNPVLPVSFPWPQLTQLVLDIPISVVAARDILIQCSALEFATFRNLWEFDVEMSQHVICTLHNLRRLDVSVLLGGGADVVLAVLSLPSLESLSTASPDYPTPVLLALIARSQFPLAHLSLTYAQLELGELFSILRLLPALETLDIQDCSCIGDGLFEMLTRDTHTAPPTFTLPHLTTLKIHPLTPALAGDIVADMAESLAQDAGDTVSGALFPRLRHLCLYREPSYSMPMFEDDVEDRLAALCATGFLVDRDPSHEQYVFV